MGAGDLAGRYRASGWRPWGGRPLQGHGVEDVLDAEGQGISARLDVGPLAPGDLYASVGGAACFGDRIRSGRAPGG